MSNAQHGDKKGTIWNQDNFNAFETKVLKEKVNLKILFVDVKKVYDPLNRPWRCSSIKGNFHSRILFVLRMRKQFKG